MRQFSYRMKAHERNTTGYDIILKNKRLNETFESVYLQTKYPLNEISGTSRKNHRCLAKPKMTSMLFTIADKELEKHSL